MFKFKTKFCQHMVFNKSLVYSFKNGWFHGVSHGDEVNTLLNKADVVCCLPSKSSQCRRESRTKQRHTQMKM